MQDKRYYTNAIGQVCEVPDNWYRSTKAPWELYPTAANPYIQTAKGMDGTVREFRWWVDKCPEIDSVGGDECPGYIIEHEGPNGAWSKKRSCPLHTHRWKPDYMTDNERMDELARRVRAACIPTRFEWYDLYNFPRFDTEWARSCRDYATIPYQRNSLLLLGTFGTGKTSLGVSILQERMKVRGEHTYFCVVPALFEAIRSSFGQAEQSNLFARAMNVGWLMLDDLGAERATEWVQEQLYTLINHRLINEKPTIVTSNMTLDDLGGQLGLRTLERLKAYKIVIVGGNNLRDAPGAGFTDPE